MDPSFFSCKIVLPITRVLSTKSINTSAFKHLEAPDALEGLLKPCLLDPAPRVSESVSGQGGNCQSDRFPGEAAAAAGFRTTL